MPFSPDVKQRMFLWCERHCCLCKKQCGLKIEAAHILDEAESHDNTEENGIPLCFDCHQEVGSYNEKHPRGNKIRPDELRTRRDRVYKLVEEGRLATLHPADLTRLRHRETVMRVAGVEKDVVNPSVAQLLLAIDGLHLLDDPFLVLCDSGWDNAFVQILHRENHLYITEYRDGATQLQYRSKRLLDLEMVKLVMLSYRRHGDELIRHAIAWKDITAQI